jgi:hypothetical protein
LEWENFRGGPEFISYLGYPDSDSVRRVIRPPAWSPFVLQTTRPDRTTVWRRVAGGSCDKWRSQKAHLLLTDSAVTQEHGICQGS